jgi:hypothetical protein
MSFLFADASPPSACLRGFAGSACLDPSDSLVAEPVFTAADYAELHEACPEVNCILSGSSWNQFSDEAMDAAHRDGVATFLFGDLMGALHQRGAQFVAYRRSDD